METISDKYESSCHGAPVKVSKGEKIKYRCTECGDPCIAVQKKQAATWIEGDK